MLVEEGIVLMAEVSEGGTGYTKVRLDGQCENLLE